MTAMGSKLPNGSSHLLFQQSKLWKKHDHLQTCIHLIGRCIEQRRGDVGLPDFMCQHCQQPFATMGGLREHMTKVHFETSGQLRIFDPAVDLHGGLPTCARCHTHFTSWDRVKYHIEFCGTCGVISESTNGRKAPRKKALQAQTACWKKLEPFRRNQILKFLRFSGMTWVPYEI